MASAEEKSPIAEIDQANVSNFNYLIHEINKKDVPELYELFKLNKIPLPSAEFSFELKNVPTAFSNAVRRVLIDELLSYRLETDSVDFINYDKHNDVYCIYSMLVLSISNIRLKYNIKPTEASKIKLRLSVTNTTQFIKSVYSGDLEVVSGDPKMIICPPNIQLCMLNPGKSVFVDNIRLVRDTGKNSGFNTVGCQVSSIPLDIPRYKKEEYINSSGKASNLACYIPQSTTVDPRHHKISGIFNCIESVEDIKSIIWDSFDNIKKRLSKIEMSIGDDSTKNVDIVYEEKKILNSDNYYEASLVLTGETHTIGNIITKYIYINDPSIGEVNYFIENDVVYLIFKSEKNIKNQILISLRNAIADFELAKESFLLL